jgi:hypothetical protein
VRNTAIVLMLSLAIAPAARAETRRWLYKGSLGGDEGEKKPIELALVETGRRTLGAYQVVDLAVQVGGKPIEEDTLGKLNPAPFGTFSAKLGLLVGKDVTALVLVGDEPLAEGTLKSSLKEAVKWRARDAKRKRPRANHEPSDRAFNYGKKTGAWPSLCQAYLHPSPDTGDFFESEKCFAPHVGLTTWSFESAWGAFELELVTPPADPAL